MKENNLYFEKRRRRGEGDESVKREDGTVGLRFFIRGIIL